MPIENIIANGKFKTTTTPATKNFVHKLIDSNSDFKISSDYWFSAFLRIIPQLLLYVTILFYCPTVAEQSLKYEKENFQ